MGKTVAAKVAAGFTDIGVPGSTQHADRRESLRVDLVGLACEIATVASLVDDKLGGMREVSADLRAQCLAYRARALELLAPKTNLATLSDAKLQEALKSFREDQVHLTQLATEAGVLLRFRPPNRRGPN